MNDAWHIVKWVWIVVMVACFASQLIVARRMGWRNRRGRWVATVTAICAMLPNTLSGIFEDRQVGRMVALPSAVVAVAMTLILLFHQGKAAGKTAAYDDAEDRIQTLGLS